MLKTLHFVSKRLTKFSKRHSSTVKISLNDVFEIVPSSSDVFCQPKERIFGMHQRPTPFGGQTIAGAIRAAHRTLIQPFPLHSLHSYFIDAADMKAPIFHTVTRIRDGKSFATRRVTAKQHDRIIFEATMSFHRRESSSIEHQPASIIPNVPPPENLLTIGQCLDKLSRDQSFTSEKRALVEKELEMPLGLDVRYCDPDEIFYTDVRKPARRLMWIKSQIPLRNDLLLQQCAVAYASDRILFGVAFYPHGICGYDSNVKLQTSLDFSIWFHDYMQSARTEQSDPLQSDDDWFLYEIQCPVMKNNRGWVYCHVWNRHGELIATTQTEGIARLR